MILQIILGIVTLIFFIPVFFTVFAISWELLIKPFWCEVIKWIRSSVTTAKEEE